MYTKHQYTIKGISGLLMHNVRLANPFDPITKSIKSITGKRKKTDADLEEVARLEWHGGLYLHNNMPCVEGKALKATLRNAGKKRKLGEQVKAAIFVYDTFPLLYHGPQTVEELWADTTYRDVTMMTVNRGKVIRCRPYFPSWSLTFTMEINDEVLNPREVTELVCLAGEVVGLLEGRPEYGRFIVVEEQQVVG